MPAHTVYWFPILKTGRSLDTSHKSLYRRARLGHTTTPRATGCADDAGEEGLHQKQGSAESVPKEDVFLRWLLFPAFATNQYQPYQCDLALAFCCSSLNLLVSEVASLLIQILHVDLPHLHASDRVLEPSLSCSWACLVSWSSLKQYQILFSFPLAVSYHAWKKSLQGLSDASAAIYFEMH